MPTDLNSQILNTQAQFGAANQMIPNNQVPFYGYTQYYTPNANVMPLQPQYGAAAQSTIVSSIAGSTPTIGLVRGLLIGAALTYVLTQPKVKQKIFQLGGMCCNKDCTEENE